MLGLSTHISALSNTCSIIRIKPCNAESLFLLVVLTSKSFNWSFFNLLLNGINLSQNPKHRGWYTQVALSRQSHIYNHLLIKSAFKMHVRVDQEDSVCNFDPNDNFWSILLDEENNHNMYTNTLFYRYKQHMFSLYWLDMKQLYQNVQYNDPSKGLKTSLVPNPTHQYLTT